MNNLFHKFATKASELVGSPWAFMVAVLIVVVWASLGPHFQWSDTHQLIINTGTTIITFLMVFLIQNTQNREARTTQLKLDELIKAIKGASNSMIDLDELSDDQLKELEQEYRRICHAGEDGDEEKAKKKRTKKR